MTKKLYSISVIYDVMVIADESETAEFIVRSHIQNIVENEAPRYVTEEIQKRESSKEVVKKVKNMLTAGEWDALKVLMSEGVE